MRILLLTPGDPFDHRSWSGTLYSITTTLKRMGHQILWHGKVPRASLLLRIKIIITRLIMWFLIQKEKQKNQIFR